MDESEIKPKLIDVSLLLLRVFIGLAIATHGYHKVFENMPQFTQGVAGLGFPAPALFAWMAALSEFAGGIMLALGLFTRFAAFFVACVMAVAVFKVHAADPFKVKELAFAYLVVSGSLLAGGGGFFSLDRAIFMSRTQARREVDKIIRREQQSDWLDVEHIRKSA